MRAVTILAGLAATASIVFATDGPTRLSGGNYLYYGASDEWYSCGNNCIITNVDWDAGSCGNFHLRPYVVTSLTSELGSELDWPTVEQFATLTGTSTLTWKRDDYGHYIGFRVVLRAADEDAFPTTRRHQLRERPVSDRYDIPGLNHDFLEPVLQNRTGITVQFAEEKELTLVYHMIDTYVVC